MASVEVQRTAEDDARFRFDVRVREGGGETRHDVTIARADYDRLRGDAPDPERFIERCFAFLLEREPKEAILSSFDVRAISRYFPEFEDEIARA